MNIKVELRKKDKKVLRIWKIIQLNIINNLQKMGIYINIMERTLENNRKDIGKRN